MHSALEQRKEVSGKNGQRFAATLEFGARHGTLPADPKKR
jgi:hypothetical protein